MSTLLAVDLGLRTGMALYGDDGRLRWYRSRHFGSRPQLKRGIYRLLNDTDRLAWLFVEGTTTADLWLNEARRRQVAARQIDAATWREEILLARERRNAASAKHHAGELARQVIAWSGAPRSASLRHDAAEAILIGLWAVHQVGWLPDLRSCFPQR